jgi:hypothetical protein
VTPDPRVEIARDYLQGARQRDPNWLPPSRLQAEVAETRRQLGQVLAAYADLEGQALIEAQRTTVLDGLGDAADLLEHRAEQWCGDCVRQDGGLCYEHAKDLDAADRYRALAREIGGAP